MGSKCFCSKVPMLQKQSKAMQSILVRYLWRFIYGMYSHIAFLIFVAIQDSTTLDGKRQSRLHI